MELEDKLIDRYLRIEADYFEATVCLYQKPTNRDFQPYDWSD